MMSLRCRNVKRKRGITAFHKITSIIQSVWYMNYNEGLSLHLPSGWGSPGRPDLKLYFLSGNCDLKCKNVKGVAFHDEPTKNVTWIGSSPELYGAFQWVPARRLSARLQWSCFYLQQAAILREKVLIHCLLSAEHETRWWKYRWMLPTSRPKRELKGEWILDIHQMETKTQIQMNDVAK